MFDFLSNCKYSNRRLNCTSITSPLVNENTMLCVLNPPHDSQGLR